MKTRSGFGLRLATAIDRMGLSQAQLVNALTKRSCRVSAGAVSQWVTGARNPERDKLSLLAELLNVELEWLEEGTASKAPLDLAPFRECYQQHMQWSFRPAPTDGGRDFGNANVWSFQPSIRTLVREALQNINDEIVDPDSGADVVFRLVRLSGAELEGFLTALKWHADNTPGAGLSEHLTACAIDTTKLGNILRDSLSSLKHSAELVLLIIEDSRTTGLIGPETGQGNFAALVRNNLDTHKNNHEAGGSYGLGKAVYWLCSRFSTVLFHSALTAEDSSEACWKRGASRVIGKTDLSWHRTGGYEWAGPGWFGVRHDQSHWAQSVWDNPALVHDLYLTRSTFEPGTSICIVGFHDPSGEVLSDIQQLGERIAREAARNFWPALASGRLQVRVILSDGRDERTRIIVEPEHHCAAFTDAYVRKDMPAGVLAGPGDIATMPVTLRTPGRKTEAGRVIRAEAHEALLIVRLASEEESRDELTGHLAMFRGSEMIIQYRPIRHLIAGAPTFHAVLMCGTATGDSVADHEAEAFLRASEPPAHDRWELTSELPARYARGGGKAISEMVTEAVRLVRELLQPHHSNTPSDGPKSLRELLRVPATLSGLSPSGQPSSLVTRVPRLENVTGKIDALGRWEVIAEVRVPDTRTWRVSPVLFFDGEGGAVVRVPWLHLVAQGGCRAEGSTLVISSPQRRARFRAVSNLLHHPAPASEAAIIVELRDIRILEPVSERRSQLGAAP